MKRNTIKQFDKQVDKKPTTKKPYGFCCDIKDQETDIQNQLSIPQPNPFVNTDPAVGPEIKFLVRERGPSYYPRIIAKVKRAASLGDCRRCTGPLQWYLEDEIAIARDMLAKKKKIEYEMETERIVKAARKRRELRNRARNLVE